jgi:hypothetical protein
MDKKPASFRLTTIALRLLRVLAEGMGLSQTAVVETAIRELAKKNKIQILQEVKEDGEESSNQ